jgi:hypothetical protein
MRSAAVAIFAYRRPNHLRRLLQSLSENHGIEEFQVYLFIDGPRTEIDFELVQKVTLTAEDFSKQLNLHVVSSPVNLGLATSIRSNVSKLFEKYDTLIVLEDDLIVSKYFLIFMSNGLRAFAEDPSIAAVSGYSYPISDLIEGGYILPGGDCWGWATWKDRWEAVNWDAVKLKEELENSGRITAFNLNGEYDYFGMLVDSELGLIDSWAIYWHASMFLSGRYTYYPCQSLVLNTGMDQSGTHFNSKSKGFEVQSVLHDYVTELQLHDLQDRSKELSALYRHVNDSNLFTLTYKIYRELRRLRRRIYRKFSYLKKSST